MNIKKLEKKERFDAYLISSYCFHSRIDDIESKREQTEQETCDQWGAYSDDGKMMAEIINHAFRFMLDGGEIPGGGIGAVATLPEYRESGVIREMFRSILADSYQRGDVISALYPFNHAFYRKFGYDTVTCRNRYELSPSLLRGYTFDGQITRWNPGDPVDEYLTLHNAFARQFSLSMLRDERGMKEHMNVGNLWKDRKFSYLFSLAGKNIAFLTFTDVYNESAAILNVEECVWIDPEGFNAILAFLGRFGADYGTIRLPLPAGIDLLRIIRTSDAYDIKKETAQGYMVRVINAKKLLDAIRKPADCDCVIRISDELIAENNITLRVTSEAVRESTDAPDLEVSVRTLGQLAVGCITLREALLKPDIRVYGKEDLLVRLFPEKPVFVNEHF